MSPCRKVPPINGPSYLHSSWAGCDSRPAVISVKLQVREPHKVRLTRCDPGTDGTVRMKEGEQNMKNSKITPQYIAVVAMFTALSFISVLFTEMIPKVEGFLSYEPKDAIIVITGLLLGPAASVIMAILVSFIEMVTISATGPYGFLMNALSTCAFVLPPTIIYAKDRTKKRAVIGLIFGVICMTIVMLMWNYIITPLYMNVDRSVVVKMLLPVFLPFNLIKGGINACLALLLYKPVVTALRATHLVLPSQSSESKPRFNVGFSLIALVVLVTFVMAFLSLSGVI